MNKLFEEWTAYNCVVRVAIDEENEGDEIVVAPSADIAERIVDDHNKMLAIVDITLK